MSYGLNKYGEYKYGEKGTPTRQEIELLIPHLMKYLPWYYQRSKVMREMQDSIAKEFGIFVYYIEDVHRQVSIDTAIWGLSIYEKELGLKTNMSLSLEERREMIKAKLRGRGTTTKEMIKNTAEAFSGGQVEVIEYPEEDYFVVRFIGVKGIPRNMQGFIDMLEMIKPAHLAYGFKYTYTIWNNLKKLIWNETNKITWDKLRTWEEV